MDSQRTILANRATERSAPQRCLAYAACSELIASPHDVDPRPALLVRADHQFDLQHVQMIEPRWAAVGSSDIAALRREYSALFEVGSDGPPAPIREQLARGDHGGVREEVVRYYDHFGYALDEKFAWQPDHLSVELEFMHFLCYHESRSKSDPQARSVQLAQVDFTQRHLGSWLPELAIRTAALAPESIYADVTASIAQFVLADLAWQQSTITTAG